MPKQSPKLSVPPPADGGAASSSSRVDMSTLDELVGYNLRRAHHVQLQRFATVFKPFDVRPVQLSILGIIYHNPAIKQSELARAMDIKRANMVALLDELEQRSLLTRRRAREDKRSHLIHLTPTGKRFTKRMLDLHAQLERDMAESLGHRERDRLLQLLKTFRRLDPAPDLGSPG
jgi:DNA-binding MarR family transcriptional regulator